MIEHISLGFCSPREFILAEKINELVDAVNEKPAEEPKRRFVVEGLDPRDSLDRGKHYYHDSNGDFGSWDMAGAPRFTREQAEKIAKQVTPRVVEVPNEEKP